MKKCITAILLLSAALQLSAQQTDGGSDVYRSALILYRQGMYERARTLFETVSAQSQDPVSEGYAVLCSINLKSEDSADLISAYDSKFPGATLSSEMHFRYASNLFAKEKYKAASAEFDNVTLSSLDKSLKPEYLYKTSYCYYAMGDLRRAKAGMLSLLEMEASDYTAPAYYTLGYMAYLSKDFQRAVDYFTEAGQDFRFTDNCAYYILDCKFMLKDYGYVIDNGIKMYDSASMERQPHIARLVSESYLVKGDAANAQKYMQLSNLSKDDMTRADYFYAGSVYYALGKWTDAIGNFNMMVARTDSLGQAANYALGFSYIQTKNKVAALGAFKDASHYSFDKSVQEDAMYNYAKLCFDLNHDSSAFSEYLQQFPSKERGDQIYSYIALADLYNHDYAGAVDAYGHVDELSPDMRGNYMKANYLRARQLVGNGAYTDAIPCLKAATFFVPKLDPFNQLATYWLAECYYRTDQFDLARSTYTDLYNNSALYGRPESSSIPYCIAYTYFDQDDYAGAAKCFDSYISTSDKTFRRDAMERRADCDFARKSYPEAINGYNNVLEAYDDLSDLYPYYQLGLAYGLTGEPKKKVAALSAAEKAASSAPFWPESMYELGRGYVSLKKESDAIRVFNKLKASSSDESYVCRALLELGLIYKNKKDYDPALTYYKEVVRLQESGEFRDDALAGIESVYQAMGEPEQYISYKESIGDKVPQTEEQKEKMYFDSAEQVFLSGNSAKAVTVIQKYLDAYPQGCHLAEAHYYLAECYKSLDNKEKACSQYVEALKHDAAGSITESSLLNYAQLSYSLEHYEDAFKAFRTLDGTARIDANKLTAKIGMMRSAFRAKDYREAVTCADLVKSSSSDEALVREADYTKAMSLLATDDRDSAFLILTSLADKPSTDEGAEASYMLIQDRYDRGQYDSIERLVIAFSEEAGDQSYWLAKAYIVLGDTYMELDRPEQAKATYDSILEGYKPSGSDDDILDSVNMRLQKLSNHSDE